MRKTTLLKSLLLLCALIVGSGSVWGGEATYTISSLNTLTPSGTTPGGSSATIVETYSTTKQMTAGNSQTLSLKGYNGYRITQIVLSMQSNKSGGAGTLSYSTDAGESFSYIVGSAGSGVAFNQSAWNGAWSTSYTNITKSGLSINCGQSDVIIKIAATANSLFCQSYKITYEAIPEGDKSTPTITFNDANVRIGHNLDLRSLFTSNSDGSVTYSITSGGEKGTIALDGYTFSGTTIGDVTVLATQSASGLYLSGSESATITVSSPKTPTSITITTPPAKTIYEVGETFESDGMTVLATFSDDSQEDITQYCTFEPSSALTIDDDNVTVSYTENAITKNANQPIYVTGVRDYALLTFSFNGGVADISTTTGLSHSGIDGTDYKTDYTKLKFNNANDYLILKINETPGTLKFNIKDNSFNGTFKVQESSDGSSYTDVETYTSISDEETKTITTLKKTTRYIKWIYSARTGGNVGLGNIKLLLGISDAETFDMVPRTNTDISLLRPFVAGWNGVVLPFDLTTEVKTALGASEVRTLKTATDTGSGITLSFDDAAMPVSAGTPVLVKLATAKTSVDLEGVNIMATAPTTIAKTAGGSTFTLTGTYSETDLQASEAYFVSNTKFYHKAAGVALTASPFRAYIIQTGEAPARIDFDLEDGGTTGIVEVNAMRNAIRESIYNLAGQRVANPTKGLYIVNGKKVIK